MNLEDKKVGVILVVIVRESRIDARIAEEFRDKMTDFIRGGDKRLLLNISEVDFVDSSGLGALISSLKRMKGDGDISICGAKTAVKSMFSITRMDQVFRLYEQEEEALNILNKN